MFTSKVNCPACGAKNPKESMSCVECGALLDVGLVEGRQTEVPQEVKPSLVSRIRAFLTVADRLRDKARDKLCDDLCAMGLDAQMVERRRPEEKIILDPGSPIGLIEIRDSPIRYVNLREHEGSQYTNTAYTNVYLVPDTRVPKGGYLQLKSARVKTKPVFGRVVDLRWEAKFIKVKMIKSIPVHAVAVSVKKDSDLIKRVNEDVRLKESLIRLSEDVTIRSLEDWGWAISTSAVSRRSVLSREQWDCYETIAQHLLQAEEGKLI